APTDDATEKKENIRPYALGPLAAMMSELMAGNRTPLAMPIESRKPANGNGTSAAMPQNAIASPSAPAAVRRKADSRFKNSRPSVASDPMLTRENRMPVVKAPSAVGFMRGSSKNRMPCEQDTASGSRKSSQTYGPAAPSGNGPVPPPTPGPR